MFINKFCIALGFVIAFVAFFELAAHADARNESTAITFSAPVQIPGKVLPAGTYVFEDADPEANLNVVQIFSSDRKVLYATVETIPTDRLQPAGDTTVTLAKPEDGTPEMLVKWFYPGTLTGHQFVYSKQQEKQIAHAAKDTFNGDQAVPGSQAVGD